LASKEQYGTHQSQIKAGHDLSPFTKIARKIILSLMASLEPKAIIVKNARIYCW
jgi:hypothetical protein